MDWIDRMRQQNPIAKYREMGSRDKKTGMLALRASVIQGIYMGNGKINLIKFFEGYPTKTVILDVKALSKVMDKVESISELLDFFTNSPLEKIKTN